jgi:hypothetical protein
MREWLTEIDPGLRYAPSGLRLLNKNVWIDA